MPSPIKNAMGRTYESQGKDGNGTMNTHDNLRYSLWIRWSDEDQLYIVEVPELPGCKTHGKTYAEAVIQAQDAMDTWLYGHRALGYAIPPPDWYQATENGPRHPLRHAERP